MSEVNVWFYCVTLLIAGTGQTPPPTQEALVEARAFITGLNDAQSAIDSRREQAAQHNGEVARQTLERQAVEQAERANPNAPANEELQRLLQEQGAFLAQFAGLSPKPKKP